MTTTIAFSRKDYLDGKCTHREYYSQFVNQIVRDKVAQKFSKSLKESNDPHFNDIPLQRWDYVFALVPPFIKDAMKEAGDYPTAAGLVCIAKEAARQIKESM